MVDANRRVLPGFRLSLGFTLSYLSLLVLIPLAACFLKASALSLDEFLAAVWTARARGILPDGRRLTCGGGRERAPRRADRVGARAL
jgi:hypothetical protein